MYTLPLYPDDVYLCVSTPFEDEKKKRDTKTYRSLRRWRFLPFLFLLDVSLLSTATRSIFMYHHPCVQRARQKRQLKDQKEKRNEGGGAQRLTKVWALRPSRSFWSFLLCFLLSHTHGPTLANPISHASPLTLIFIATQREKGGKYQISTVAACMHWR